MHWQVGAAPVPLEHSRRHGADAFSSFPTGSPGLPWGVPVRDGKSHTFLFLLRSESLVHHLETDSGAGTRDPPAASWSTALSEDRKPTRFTRDQQDLPHCPWSSEGVPLALGCPGGTSGRPRGHVQVQPRARGGRPNTVYDEPARR
ncbi:tripartite motif-containing protein 15 [Felis catus]|uniref:tripartite motif-containing protein 15 n=1 Tax=Felis catus TaxID=9685 RepID=UPI001D1A2302|nr:tripartite motif-containing protein 15 [Felis catus]